MTSSTRAGVEHVKDRSASLLRRSSRVGCEGRKPASAGEGRPAEPPAASPLDGALASLTTVFDELLSGLGDSIATALRLPDPSPPSGNGSAYEKFLAMYNSLRGMAPTVNEVG